MKIVITRFRGMKGCLHGLRRCHVRLLFMLGMSVLIGGWTQAQARSHHHHAPYAAGYSPVPAAQQTHEAVDAANPTASVRAGRASASHVPVAELPDEVQATLQLIHQGGPYPYEKDGSVFGNYEGRLPRQRRGYYREYTVKTPRDHSRGARRVIVGGPAGRPTEFYYTDDHYQTFRRIDFP